MRTLALIRPVQFDHSRADAVSLHYRPNGLNSPVFLDAVLTHVDTLAILVKTLYHRGRKVTEVDRRAGSPLHSDLRPLLLRFLRISLFTFPVKDCVFHGYLRITFIIQCLNKIRSAITFGGTADAARC